MKNKIRNMQTKYNNILIILTRQNINENGFFNLDYLKLL